MQTTYTVGINRIMHVYSNALLNEVQKGAAICYIHYLA